MSQLKPKTWATEAAAHSDELGHAVMMADDGAWCEDCGQTWQPTSQPEPSACTRELATGRAELTNALPKPLRVGPTTNGIEHVPWLLRASAAPDLQSITTTCLRVTALLQIVRAGDVDPETLLEELEGVHSVIAEFARLAAS